MEKPKYGELDEEHYVEHKLEQVYRMEERGERKTEHLLRRKTWIYLESMSQLINTGNITIK